MATEEITIARMGDAIFEPTKVKVEKTEEEQAAEEAAATNEMIRRMRELASQAEEEKVNTEPTDGRPPLEEALEKAIYSFTEIEVYATYGRMQECVREAKDALTALNALKQKYDEQNLIMSALSNPITAEDIGGYA
jgi:hypothetical protein